MKVFLDTNVVVAAVVTNHNRHEDALAALDRVQNSHDDGFVSSHSLAEMYAVLTRLPPPMRHSPEQALLTIEENVLQFFKISALTGDDYAELIRESGLAGIQGGTIYDAVLLKCAHRARVECLYTFNLKHFQAIAPRTFRAEIFDP
jgi:predicted nucleic acid-binding protein